MTRSDIRRIFINNIDQYQSHHLAKYLSNCIVGAAVDGMDEEMGEEEHGDGAESNRYKISGTTKDPLYAKPAFVEEILRYENKTDLLEHIMEFDIVIYDIFEENQVDEAVMVMNRMFFSFRH